MAITHTIEVLNAMEAAGIIGRYAIAGAVAAYNYIEPTPTEDLDILVAIDSPFPTGSGLVTLEPIFSYLRGKGHTTHEKEGILIGEWRVQFLPVASDLDREALAEAQDIEVDGDGHTAVKTRVLKAEHIVAICLHLGRPKDLIRVSQFLTELAVNVKALCAVLSRHQLQDSWRQFCQRTGSVDPCLGGTR